MQKTDLAHHTIAQLWAQAEADEQAGDRVSAVALYHAIVERDATRTPAWLRLSALAQAEGHYVLSRSYLTRAATAMLASLNLQHLGFLTQRLLSFDEHALVARLIDAAPRSSPELLAQSAVLSQHLWLTGHHQAALDLIDAVAPKVRPSHLLSYSRANALRQCGRMAEATAEYERCIALSPGYAFAHWSLAYHQPSTPPGVRVERIRAAQAALLDDSPEQAWLNYALFKELDDADDTTAAWQALTDGARIARRSVRHDSATERAGTTALIQQATRDFVQPDEAAYPIDSTAHVPIFIVGMPRTGTTVLERILGNHSAIASAGELNDFHASLCSVADAFLGNVLDPATVARVSGLDFNAVGRTYLQRTAHRTGSKRYLVDKNPMNVYSAACIARALPTAKIVCLRRDPMDACFSNLKELFAGNAYAYSYDLQELAEHALRFDDITLHWQRVLGDRVLMVDYESLVSDPVATAQRVMAFCGVDFEADAVDITRNTAPSSTASSSQVRQPIHERGIGAWQRYASQLEPLRASLRHVAADPRSSGPLIATITRTRG